MTSSASRNWRVERAAEPHLIWDLHELFSTMVYGTLYLPSGSNLILSSLEDVEALEQAAAAVDQQAA